MAHLTPDQLRAAAAHHAERAHELLADADAAWAGAVPGGKVPEREALRIELAEAHAACATALSSLVLPLGPATG